MRMEATGSEEDEVEVEVGVSSLESAANAVLGTSARESRGAQRNHIMGSIRRCLRVISIITVTLACRGVCNMQFASRENEGRRWDSDAERMSETKKAECFANNC